ncbi:3-keto-5-aminohexanoate cleavage protein [Rhizobium sp. Leaf262]|uniref:3-keto-5-aminohexanoate cleavage protein n=1 Tax=Rhizobium sp. Leaf262 TaxID=1736312 RepID=UPI000712637E|nr:3-keto-5-aminohexanoate cleavage protein [Rhizobium sp. Leaf262]KQO83747.1 class III aminotransferase [Rhizobium sp. Leaf262]
MTELNTTAPRDRGIAIAVAPNGGRRLKADHPALPISPDELAECAVACLDAGASMIHVHVRDDDGRHSLDVERYRAAIAAIRARVSDRLIIQVTTEALGLFKPAEQIDLVRVLRPEACSIALREIAPDASYEGDFADLLAWMRRERIVPQIILYDSVDLERLEDLLQRGVIPADDIPVLFVLGRYTTHQQSSPLDLSVFTRSAAVPFAHWSVCAFGRDEAACAVSAALMGGNVRLGFENNLHLPDGTTAADNAALIAPVRNSLHLLGRKIETAETQRAALETIW